MTTPMTRATLLRGAAAGALLLCAATACNDFLAVKNPGAEPIERIGDPANANLLVNGAIAEFQSMIGDVALYGGDLSDEITAAHSNNSYRDLDRRVFDNSLDLVTLTYRPIHRARFAADTSATSLIKNLGTAAGSDPRVARMLAFSGYSLVILGETFCSSPVNVSAPLTPKQLFELSIPKFDSAITIATAAKAAATSAGAIAQADSLLNLALVGAARASLDAGDKTKALAYAQQVPAAFEFRVYYSEGIPTTPGLPINPFWNATGVPGTPGLSAGNSSNGIAFSSAALWYIVADPFQGLNDPRMPITTNKVSTMNATAGLATGFVPLKPRSFGGWTAAGAPITPGASIRIASGIEAQYIAAEANGGTATTLAFVNAERAKYSKGVSTAVTPDEILADLRDQRRREFFLDGHRLGDIRRYKEQYGLNFFPTGTYLTGPTTYGTAECMPIPVSEINANPNVPSGT
jgi:hypothetical protein